MGTIRHWAAMAAAKRAGRGRHFSGLLALVVVFIMAACGGGSSAPEEAPVAVLNLAGTVSAEAAMAGAAVAVKCASGPAQTITAGDGTFALALRAGALPCMIEVSSGGHVYRSVVLGSGAGTHRVNASPLTELVVARIAGLNGSTPTALFAGFSGNNAALTSAALDGALGYLRTAFAALADLNGFNPMSDVVVAASATSSANALGSRISAFLAQATAAQTSLDALVAAVLSSQADPAPLLPRVTAQPVSTSVQAPQAATFSVLASSVLAPGYQWQMSADGGVSFADITGATGASYTLAATQTTDSGRVFRVRIDSAGGSVTSSGAALTVTAPAPTAPEITTQPQSTSAPYGQTASFSVNANSSGAMSYQWSRNGMPIAGATGASYTTPMTVPGDNGALFTVTTSNSVGSTVSAAATLTVTGIPAAAFNHVAAGSSHSVALRSDGSVVSWGNTKADIGTSLSGLMGVGNEPVVAGTPTVVKNAAGTVFGGAQAIAAGQWSTLVLKTDGTVWGWGYSGWGNLGNSTGYSFEQKSPVQVRLSNGSPLTAVIQLATGLYSTSVAVTADGSVWGWGQNRYGHLGTGAASETGQYTPVAMLSASGAGRFTDAVQAVAGISSTAVLKRDGTVYTVGWAGPLGDGSTVNRTLPGRVETAPGVALTNVVSIAAGGHFYVAVTSEGTAYAWGANGKGQLGDGSQTSRGRPVLVRDAGGKPVTGIVAAAAGVEHAVFLKSDGTVWASGNNDIGQLGSNSSASHLANPALVKDVSGAAFGEVVGIAALDSHTVVRRSDGSVWSWGSNVYLQLGDMTAVHRRNPVKVQLPAP
jgi:alpha-tubulin suppressor-like RCC1 family protein